MINKAEMFYANNQAKAVDEKMVEIEREKITQDDALAQINSKTCDLTNKDAGYLNFDGLDLRHCNMINTSFLARIYVVQI